MHPLVEKFKRSLQTGVTIAPGKTITVRRPLPGETVESPEILKTPLSLILHCTESWDGFTEKDFYSGGDESPVAFDKELYSWWLKDHPEHWEQIYKAVNDQINDHQAKVEEAEKK